MKEYEKWFRKAENDLLGIENNLSAKKIPADVCCFHAQQAVEKYLKAYPLSKNINFPKTHDLELLVKLAMQINPFFDGILETALHLGSYAITPRYPDMVDDLTIEDAKNAYADAIFIKEFILKHFF